YKDHLGNVRLSYADINGNGTIEPATEILEENNYYPFGLKHKGYNEIVNSNRSEAAEKYKFGGKELNNELGLDLYDFSARNYDPALGRWLNVDPLAEHPNQVDKSPYAYTWNNPVNLTDPDGMCPICPFIAKGLTGAGIDYMLQGAMNYAGGMNLTDAFSTSNIDMSDVALSGAQGMIPWSVPGGKYGKAAGAAFSDVMFNYGKS